MKHPTSLHEVLMDNSFPSGAICCAAASEDGLLFCSVANDKSLKVFDVINFGMNLLLFSNEFRAPKCAMRIL